MTIAQEEMKIEYEILNRMAGALDANFQLIEKLFNVRIKRTELGIELDGSSENTSLASELVGVLAQLIKQGNIVTRVLVERCADMVKMGESDQILDLYREVVAVTARGKKIICKTLGQRYYCREMKKNILTFAIGPAGTGKTYLAVANAVSAYKRGEVDKIILTRPAIEAGEKLGFLPGDLQMKVDPYLRPLYDALEELFGVDDYNSLIEKGVIEIAPLAFMRGRTLSKAFIILDEAQNTTEEQMKMFLSRLGDGSRMVVTGDITQIDLPACGKSGLKQAASLLADIDDISVCFLTDKDVVRHELVQRIVKAYETKLQKEKGK